MRKLSLLFSLPAVLWMSCNRSNDNILGSQTAPLLIKIITKDSTGSLIYVANYSEFGIISDTTFSSTQGTVTSSKAYEYNSKGKEISLKWYLPVFYTAGYHWAYKYYYDNDTTLRITEAYINDRLSTTIKRYYSSPGQISIDSVFQVGANARTSLINYSYDVQGRMLSAITINLPNDTAFIRAYQYPANTVEEQNTTFYPATNTKSVSKKITDYRSDGKILSEKETTESGQVTKQIDYSYESGGRLTNKKTTTASSSSEEIYTYDASGWLIKELIMFSSEKREFIYTNNINGKPEKMEKYVNDKLVSTTIYYYQ